MSLFQPLQILEGDFTSWAIYDSFDETDTSSKTLAVSYAVFNLEETKAIIADVAGKRKTYTIASKAVSAAHAITNPSDSYTTSKHQSSAYGRYHVINNNAGLVISKNGVEIQTLLNAALGLNAATLGSVSISPKGKYIAVAGERSASGNVGWVILVGS